MKTRYGTGLAAIMLANKHSSKYHDPLKFKPASTRGHGKEVRLTAILR